MSDEAARAVVLRRIRAASAERAQNPAPGAPPAAVARVADAGPSSGALTLFEERLRDYDADVERACASEVADVVERVLEARGRPRMISPPGLPSLWIPASLGVAVDEGFSARDLDAFEGVITGATLGIAETGTLVLQTVSGQGRRALSLVPDFHLCILRAEDVVCTVAEAVVRLDGLSSLPTTFISGPSATADIEMTRIRGVHGPRFLHVVLVLRDEECFDNGEM